MTKRNFLVCYNHNVDLVNEIKRSPETAANAAVCTSCILCWKSTKAGPSDFCSQACEGLASARAPFLIEIPRGHVAFKKGI